MSRTATTSAVADAIREVLTSPNVADANFEPANIVDVTSRIGDGIHRQATALEAIASALGDLADAIREKK